MSNLEAAFPGASHLFILGGIPSHRTDDNQRAVDWVEQYTSETKRPKIDGAPAGSIGGTG